MTPGPRHVFKARCRHAASVIVPQTGMARLAEVSVDFVSVHENVLTMSELAMWISEMRTRVHIRMNVRVALKETAEVRRVLSGSGRTYRGELWL